MAIFDEVKKMQNKGLSESQIIQNLQDEGVSYREISQALEQSKIKAAVESGEYIPAPVNETPEGRDEEQAQNQQITNQGYREMQPSIMEEPSLENQQEYIPQEYSQQEGQGYEQYESYQQSSLSSDTITEISEQIVSERLSDVRRHIEKMSDFKTTAESKIEYLDERIKRIEKILDTLQSSILRKVGDYVTNVQDIKAELIETQQTFSKLVPELRKKTAKHHSTEHHKKK